MIKKILNNIKKIYSGFQGYLFRALNFASINTSKTISIIGAIAISLIIVSSIVLQSTLAVIYGVTDVKKDIKVSTIPQKSY